MSPHVHLTAEEIFERILEGQDSSAFSDCPSCAAEAASLGGFIAAMKRADAQQAPTNDWDDLLLRKRIREAVAQEKPYVPSIFQRFWVLRPALAAALIVLVGLGVWRPLSRSTEGDLAKMALANPGSYDRLPAWTPLPDEADDDGLAVLAEWTPTEDELAIARCRASCLAGLSSHEEEKLFSTVAMNSAQSPMPGASPL